MNPVFISYRRTWGGEVQALADACRLRGLRVFHDVSDPEVLAGKPQYDQIRSIVRDESAAFLLHLTQDIVESDSVWKLEVPSALARLDEDSHFPVVPFFRDIGPSGVRSDMPPWGQRLASLGGVVAVPSADSSLDEQTMLLRTKHAEAATQILELLLQRRNDNGIEDGFRIAMQTRDVGSAERRIDMALDWRIGYPNDIPSAEGCSAIMSAVDDIAAAIGKTSVRRIQVLGRAHLSSAILLGTALSEVAGFELEVSQGDDTWESSGRAQELPLDIHQSQVDPACPDIFLAVGISRPEVVESAERAINDMGIRYGGRVTIEPVGGGRRDAIESGAQARSIVVAITNSLMNVRVEWGPGPIHLFISAPFAMAVLLGHRLNALGPIRIYEHDKSTDTYREAFVIP